MLQWYAADSNDDVTVRFQVLDPPSILGSTVNKIPSSYMNPTADAIAVLKAGIDCFEARVQWIDGEAHPEVKPEKKALGST